MVRPARRGAAGYTLLELMFAVVVLGILGMAVSRLYMVVFASWFRGGAALNLHAEARRADETLVNSLRSASMSNVILTRADSLEPPLSKVCFVDATGNSRMIYQQGGRIYQATWNGNTATALAANPLLDNFVENLTVYYPNIKEPNKLAYSLVLQDRYLSNQNPLVLQTAGTIELKAP